MSLSEGRLGSPRVGVASFRPPPCPAASGPSLCRQQRLASATPPGQLPLCLPLSLAAISVAVSPRPSAPSSVSFLCRRRCGGLGRGAQSAGFQGGIEAPRGLFSDAPFFREDKLCSPSVTWLLSRAAPLTRARALGAFPPGTPAARPPGPAPPRSVGSVPACTGRAAGRASACGRRSVRDGVSGGGPRGGLRRGGEAGRLTRPLCTVARGLGTRARAADPPPPPGSWMCTQPWFPASPPGCAAVGV